MALPLQLLHLPPKAPGHRWSRWSKCEMQRFRQESSHSKSVQLWFKKRSRVPQHTALRLQPNTTIDSTRSSRCRTANGTWRLKKMVLLCGLTQKSLLPTGPSPNGKYKAHCQATQLKLNVPRYHRSSGRLNSARHCARLHCEMPTRSTKVLSTVLHTSHHLWQSKL